MPPSKPFSRARRLACLLLWPWLTGPVFALERVDLYRVSVPVADASPEAAEAAARTALAEVLVRLTGEALAPGDDLATRLAARLDALLLERGYVNLPGRIDPAGNIEATRTALQLRFDPEALRAALGDAGRQVWSPVRPVTLLALGIGRGGGFEWVTEEDATGYADLLRAAASRRALPLRLPLTPPATGLIAAGDDLLAPHLDALAASRAADRVLLGVIEQAADGSASVAWHLRTGDGLSRWTASAPNLEGAVLDGLDRLALALRELEPALAPGHTAEHSFAITGVRGLADWARLWPRLQQAEGGRGLGIQRLEGERIWLSTGVPGGAAALMLDPALAGLVEPDGDAWRLLPLPVPAADALALPPSPANGGAAGTLER